MNQIVSMSVCGSYAARSIADELKLRNSILGRPFSGERWQCENSNLTDLDRPTPYTQPQEA